MAAQDVFGSTFHVYRFQFGRNGLPPVSRRCFMQGLAAGGVVAGTSWPRSLWALKSDGEQQVLAGTSFDLVIGETTVNFTGRSASRDHRQRLAARARAALARGNDGRAECQERNSAVVAPRSRDVDSLARHPAAREHGRRARRELQRHRPRRDVSLSIHGTAERHVLVPQPLGFPGASRAVRCANHRSCWTRALQLRPRLRGAALRLDRSRSRCTLCAAQEDVGPRQLLQAHCRRLHSAMCSARGGQRRSRIASCGARCG